MNSVTLDVDVNRSADMSEQTPLLRSTSGHRDNGTVGSVNAVTVAGKIHQDEGAASAFPHPRSARESDSEATDEVDAKDLVRFKKNGKLEGVGDWQFRCVFGGIVLGYLVSQIEVISSFAQTALSLHLCLISDHHVRFYTHGIQPSGHHLVFPCFEFCIMALNSLFAHLNIVATAHGSAL